MELKVSCWRWAKMSKLAELIHNGIESSLPTAQRAYINNRLIHNGIESFINSIWRFVAFMSANP